MANQGAASASSSPTRAVRVDQGAAPQQRGSIAIAPYGGEEELAQVMDLVDHELSEPYTIFTYRYFIQQWPQLCFVAHDSAAGGQDGSARHLVGVVICKLDRHLKGQRLMRGYIGMLSIERAHRGRGIATRLLQRALAEMVQQGAQEIALETETDNEAALRLYESLGFIKTKRLFHYYLNGKDSFRLILSIPEEYWVTAPFVPSKALARQDMDQQGGAMPASNTPAHQALSSMSIA